MTTQISVWGEHGKLYADRQEVRVFLADGAGVPEGYGKGWTVRYTTELTPPVQYYLRGEEYSAQLEHFARRIIEPQTKAINSFESSAETDVTIQMIRDSSQGIARPAAVPASSREGGFLARILQRS
jgi:hypothetical protein